jgi:hypothetical protein
MEPQGGSIRDLNPSLIKELEQDHSEKPVPTFSHPALCGGDDADPAREWPIMSVQTKTDDAATATPAKALSPAAQRALDEAQARRAAIDARAAELRREKEVNGRGGLEPVRYDDWEVKGIASDF